MHISSPEQLIVSLATHKPLLYIFYIATGTGTVTLYLVPKNCFDDGDGSLMLASVFPRYLLICGNDVLLILGSMLKQTIETRSQEEDGLWDVCSLLLGTANLLVWFGLLR